MNLTTEASDSATYMSWDSDLPRNIIPLDLFVNRQNLTIEGLTPRSKNGVYRYFNTVSVQLLSCV